MSNSIFPTPFHLTTEELLLSSAATIFFRELENAGRAPVTIQGLCGPPQYGYTDSARSEAVGPRFVRITDIKGGKVNWETVPYCACENPAQYLVRAGDILVARAGSVGKSFLVSDVPEPAVFASYMIRLRANDKTRPGYIYWFFQSRQFWLQVADASRGSAMGNINGKMLAGLTLPNATPSEQQAISDFLGVLQERLAGKSVDLPELKPPFQNVRRIVARIEELAAKIEEARGLRRKAVQQCDNLLRSIIFNDRADYRLTAMHELVKLREPDVQVQPDEVYQFAGVYCFGEGVFKGPCKSGLEFAYNRLTRLHTGNFVYPKLMAWEGALGIVPDDCDGFVVSTEFPVFEVDQSCVLPEILDVYFRSPQVWPLLSATSTGTNVRRRRLNPRDFLEFQMPLPPMSEQLQFREVKKQVDAVKRLQAETSAELEALLPSVLDRAFKGEL